MQRHPRLMPALALSEIKYDSRPLLATAGDQLTIRVPWKNLNGLILLNVNEKRVAVGKLIVDPENSLRPCEFLIFHVPAGQEKARALPKLDPLLKVKLAPYLDSLGSSLHTAERPGGEALVPLPVNPNESYSPVLVTQYGGDRSFTVRYELGLPGGYLAKAKIMINSAHGTQHFTRELNNGTHACFQGKAENKHDLALFMALVCFSELRNHFEQHVGLGDPKRLSKEAGPKKKMGRPKKTLPPSAGTDSEDDGGAAMAGPSAQGPLAKIQDVVHLHPGQKRQPVSSSESNAEKSSKPDAKRLDRGAKKTATSKTSADNDASPSEAPSSSVGARERSRVHEMIESTEESFRKMVHRSDPGGSKDPQGPGQTSSLDKPGGHGILHSVEISVVEPIEHAVHHAREKHPEGEMPEQAEASTSMQPSGHQPTAASLLSIPFRLSHERSKSRSSSSPEQRNARIREREEQAMHEVASQTTKSGSESGFDSDDEEVEDLVAQYQ